MRLSAGGFDTDAISVINFEEVRSFTFMTQWCHSISVGRHYFVFDEKSCNTLDSSEKKQ